MPEKRWWGMKRRIATLRSALPTVTLAAMSAVLVLSACGAGNQQGLRQLIDEVGAVRTTAEQGDLTEARRQLDDLRVTAGVLRGRGRITAEDLAAFREAVDRVEAELATTQQSVLAAAAPGHATTTVTSLPTATTTTPPTTAAPTTTEPAPPPEPGKRKGQDEEEDDD